MPDLLDSSNYLPLARRLAGAAAACLGAWLLTAYGHRDDAQQSVAAACIRSLSTLAPIMSGGIAPCAATPATSPQERAVRLATAIPAGAVVSAR